MAYTELTDGRSTFHDDLRNLKVWPKAYGSRDIIGKLYKDYVFEVEIAQNIKRLYKAQASGGIKVRFLKGTRPRRKRGPCGQFRIFD